MFEAAFILLSVAAAVLPGQALPECAECPVNGHWTPWIDTTTCSATCGYFGKKAQTRNCESWFDGCPCRGAYSRIVRCASPACTTGNPCDVGHTKVGAICKATTTRTDNYVLPTCNLTKIQNFCPCPFGGVWSAWSNNGPCSATCGMFGKVDQVRTCTSTSFGCPCVGIAIRKAACPTKLCAGPKPCAAAASPMVRNPYNPAIRMCLQTKADPPLVPLPACLTTACGMCNANTPMTIDLTSNGTVAFAQDYYDRNPRGCVVRVLVCTPSQFEGGSTTQFDQNTTFVRTSSRFETRTLLTCNSAGTGWELAVGSYTNAIVQTAACFQRFWYA